MKDFSGIDFHGTFRVYQDKVLKGANEHIKDGKVNIVAAPGSGKTILGLELIRRLDSPCLIFSPTVTIRDQWGSRFEDFFLNDNQKIEDYFSTDLNNLKLITSVTYQALFSAIKKVKCEDDDETVDYSNIDLFKIVNEIGIKTICLDESHHLQNEWQKALEIFINGLDSTTKIVSLTATPPYDASDIEWQRYESICGPIDEEIFVPELIKTNTLCPHQDYIYLNYPTEKEIEEINNYKNRVEQAINNFKDLPSIKSFSQKIYNNYKNYFEEIYSSADEFIYTLTFLKKIGIEINKKLIKALTGKRFLPDYNIDYAEKSVNFLVKSTLFTDEEKEEIKKYFKSYSLIERGKICLNLNERLRKKLISSMGKLESIEKIVDCEINCLKNKLRMLILTDFIKKESTKEIGTSNDFSSISIVSIFETIRRKFPNSKIGALSGSLVILPTNMKEYLSSKKEIVPKGFSSEEIPNTNFSIFNFKGSNKEKVSIVGKIFSSGEINILVGTKSLLGEGWDSPCINSLILASFVGSFMLSNQMRGRAIRIDKNNPDKVSNIWHLVTVEPPHIVDNKPYDESKELNVQTLDSIDYKTLERRFKCFVGPNFTTGKIESGVERVTLIQPPYTKEGVSKINDKMTTFAANRDNVSNVWKEATYKTESTLKVVTQIPKTKPMLGVMLQNSFTMYLLCMITVALQGFLIANLLINFSVVMLIITIVLALFGAVFGKRIFYRIKANITPFRAIKQLSECVLKTLKKLGLTRTRCRILLSKIDNFNFTIELVWANRREDSIFNKAITELYSPIDNPRYIIIKKGLFGYRHLFSFACPSVIAQKKEYVEILKKELELSFGRMAVVYTRNEKGRRFILECRKKSYVTKNEELINKFQLKD